VGPSGRRMFGKILVGYDGSAHAHRAAEAAIALAGKFHAALTVAVVRPDSAEAPPPDLERLFPIGEESRPLGVVLDDLRDRAVAAGASAFDATVLRGDTVDLLVGALERGRFDLAVVGSRGLTPGRRIFLGSVSSALVDRAPCPVLVVRPHRRPAVGRPLSGGTGGAGTGGAA